ncbi:MAG: hypothetical protein HOD92_25950 [Deltaproteobacteria bacterium]|jgi:hypothetical protein|nr:hypothetical protein [Deltaproteobacteria bacterium]MBT4526513.1 hypothetical protein [Deltaproteobacteria bacterium]
MTEIDEEDFGLLAYQNRLTRSVEAVQTEMSMGHITSDEELRQCIDRVSGFTDPRQAFLFFTNSIPHQWQEYVTPNMIMTWGPQLWK